MFYNYHQNNSGGSFILNKKVRIEVIIEANTAEEADSLVETHGVYFNGCYNGYDCECCGDRWSESWSDGDEAPMHYGEPFVDEVEDYKESIAVVYYKDGTRKYFSMASSFGNTWLDMNKE